MGAALRLSRRATWFLACILSTVAGASAKDAASSGVTRRDFFVRGNGQLQLFVRELRWARTGARKSPILLLHGARVPGIASFDLPVPRGSLAVDLAEHGHLVYVMDARGYGRSTRPPEMSQPPSNHPPLVRSSEVVKDIGAVVEEIRRRSSSPRVVLFGWATGGHWLAQYATLFPERVSHLILLNSLYGRTSEHRSIGHGSDLEDPAKRGRINPSLGAYRFNPASSLLLGWDRSIPDEEKAAWRDPAIADAYVAQALASDSESGSHTPPAFRSPNGALEDSFYLAIGHQFWDASLIRAPTLIIRSERDFWSRPEDVDRLVEDLVHAPVEVVRLANATHFVHLDRSERGRAQLLEAVFSFLGK